MTIETAIALNRFGLGVRPGQAVSGKSAKSPKAHLLDQLSAFDPVPSVIRVHPNAGALAAFYAEYREASRKFNRLKKANDEGAKQEMARENKKMARRSLRDHYTEAGDARLAAAVQSPNDFAERLTHFWSNHFAVSVEKPLLITFAGNYEFAAIRPNIMGKFSDLLGAVVTHPAMLLYLDQAQSIGPNSAIAARVKRRRSRNIGLNENLAREILELHTLGVRTGYDQNDVTELARGLTGLTVVGLGRGGYQRRLRENHDYGDVLFYDPIHEPGTRTLLGKSYGQSGAKQATAMLSDLSTHPSTAKHIATKLARHFVSDNPPASLVKKLEQSFLKTGGDLPSLYRVLIEAPEAWPVKWSAEEAKFKSPWDWVVSTLRGLEVDELPGNRGAVRVFRQLAQPIWRPESPAGYADNMQTWAGGAALLRRFEVARRVSRLSSNNVDARMLAPKILPGVLSDNSAESIARAANAQQGLSLMLISPEFLRR